MRTLDVLFGGGGGGGGCGDRVPRFCVLFIVVLVLVVCSIFSVFRILVVFFFCISCCYWLCLGLVSVYFVSHLYVDESCVSLFACVLGHSCM